MKLSRIRTTLWLILLMGLAGLWLLLSLGHPPVVSANQPNNVTLSSFDVIPLDNAVRIEWSTDTEIDLAGFYVQRTQSIIFITLEEIGFIPGTGGDVSGADYEAIDNTAVNGQTYTYKLIEVETNSNVRDLATETVTLPILPTPTAAVIGGGNDNPTHTPSPQTTTPTRTPTRGTPSGTTTPTATPGSQLTATPIPPTSTPAQPTTPATPTQVVIAPLPTAVETATDTPVPVPIFPTNTPLPPPTPETIVTTSANAAEDETTRLVTDPPSIFDPVLTGDEVGVVLLAAATPAPILSRPQPTTAPLAIAPVQHESPPTGFTEGRVLLWLGFLSALVLFLASVVGSIILFTRKQQPKE